MKVVAVMLYFIVGGFTVWWLESSHASALSGFTSGIFFQLLLAAVLCWLDGDWLVAVPMALFGALGGAICGYGCLEWLGFIEPKEAGDGS